MGHQLGQMKIMEHIKTMNIHQNIQVNQYNIGIQILYVDRSPLVLFIATLFTDQTTTSEMQLEIGLHTENNH